MIPFILLTYVLFNDDCSRQDYITIIVQRDATQSSVFIILQVHSTCFGCQPHPSSEVHKLVTTASGTGQRGQACPRWREVAAQKI